ncbi:hypothetical protein ACFL08_05510 [Patescibacteria group bacterium]
MRTWRKLEMLLSVRINRKYGIEAGDSGLFGMIVNHVKERQLAKEGKRGAHFILRCGCCGPGGNTLDIYYEKDSEGKIQNLEIGGINGSAENWREILLPMLGVGPDAVKLK